MDILLIAAIGGIIGAISGTIGAIFATWRWDYARKAYDLQKKQLYLQILMLAESREYWRMPKMQYVGKKSSYKADVSEEIKCILGELENVK